MKFSFQIDNRKSTLFCPW